MFFCVDYVSLYVSCPLYRNAHKNTTCGIYLYKVKEVGAAEGIKAPHNVIMEDRHTLTVSGISDVDSFDEQTVIVFTDMGELTVKGEGLHINRLSLEVGEIMIEGSISSLSYSDSKPTQEGGFWSRVFR